MKICLMVFCILVALSVQAQYKMIFTNVNNNETVAIEKKVLARLSYHGYMNQPQEAEGHVTVITDSSVSLAPRRKFLQKKSASQIIRTRDITGFRLYSKFRPAAEIIYSVAGVGITGAVAGIVSNGNSSTAATIITSAATAALTTALKNAIFSHRIKNHLADGWIMSVVQDSTIQAKK